MKMLRLAVAALLVVLLPVPGSTETIKIRSGEHPGFSRLVIQPDVATGWSLGRADGKPDTYELRLDRSDAVLDAAGVFDLIPRTRIAEVQPGDVPGSLRVTLACDCHAKAFDTGQNLIVIDIADGAAADGSPFEALLDPVALPATPDLAASEKPDLPPMRPIMPVTLPRVSEGIDPSLPLYWRDIGTTDLPPAPPKAAVRTAEGAPESEVAGGTVIAPHPMADSIVHLPDARAQSAQDELLRQLSRAAAQGLITVVPETAPRHAEVADRVSAPQPPAPADERSLEQAAAAGGPDARTTPLAVHAQTSVDRDSLALDDATDGALPAEACLSSETVAVQDWGDGRPASMQIADLRNGLVGEFDMPSEEGAIALVRLYLHLGFGLEAAGVLDALASESADHDLYRELAAILDEVPLPPAAVLPGMAACNTAAALWAVLAQDDIAALSINHGAVLRAFSALPPHLRRHLGPDLARKFLLAGADDVARAIRDAVARAPEDAALSIAAMDAQLAGSQPDAAATSALDTLVGTNSLHARDALATAIEGQLKRGEAVDEALAEAAAAFAFEHEGEPQGARLQRLHVLARASSGNFEAAFDAYDRWTGEETSQEQRATMLALAEMLAGAAPDAEFLAQYFAHRDAFEDLDPDVMLRLQLGGRLAEIGFPAEVRRLVKGEAATSRSGRLILARAALREYAPEAALEMVGGLSATDALALKAEALAMLDRHAEAADTLAALGLTEAEAAAAWRGGNWARVAEIAPEARRRAVSLLGLAPAAVEPVGTEAVAGTEASAAVPSLKRKGPIEAGRALVGQSAELRATIDMLLAPSLPAKAAGEAPAQDAPDQSAAPQG